MLPFNLFISSFPTNSCVKNSITAEAIYTKIIWDPQIRIAMAEYSDANKPAILACGKIIEEYCANDSSCDIDLNNKQIKQTIGRMIAASLAPLGYTKKRFTPFPKSNNCIHFTSGSVFHKTKEGTQKIVKTIVHV